jgi:surface antigen
VDNRFLRGFLGNLDKFFRRKEEPRSAFGELLETTQPERRTYKEQEIIDKILKGNGRLPVLPENGSTNIYGGNHDQCVAWAKERRVSLGGEPLPPASIGNDPGAKNYIQKYSSSINQVNKGNLDEIISETEPGAALVYPPNSSNPFGHVAIVEAIQDDGIWISEANWGWVTENGKLVYRGTSCVRFIAKNKLESLYIIPHDAKPG